MAESSMPEAGGATRPRAGRIWIVVASLLLVAAAVTTLAVALRHPSLQGDQTDTPGAAGWLTSTPEEQGMDSARLEAMMAYVDEHDMAVDSVVVVRHGHIVFERYGDRYDTGTIHKLHSVTKSVMSMLVGIAVDSGDLGGLDVPLAELLPDHSIADPDPRKARITLEHLLTMSEGLDWNEGQYPYRDPRNIAEQMEDSADPIQFVVDRPMAREPGEAWAYNSGDSMLLGAILDQATGRDLTVFAREVLFDPLGIRLAYWDPAPGGHYYTHGGLSITSRDMARLGYLMLHGGAWDGRQIVPDEWVTRSTAAYYAAEGGYGYGYQWWILPDGRGYKAQGLYDQRIVVLPEADMVVVFTASIPVDSLYHVDGLVDSFILAACTDMATEPVSETYDAYGFTFAYPAGFRLTEEPIPGHDTLSDESGIVQITSNSEPMELVSVLWAPVDPGGDLEAFLDEYLGGLAASLEGLMPGESRMGEKDGHPMALRFSQATMQGGTLPLVSGVWICDRTGRAFGATYLTTATLSPDELLAAFEQYLAGLACH